MSRASAEMARLLDQRVSLRLRDTSLQNAVEELSDRTGIAIQADPRCWADGNHVVSLRAENDITARGVLESWANMFDLKMIEDEDRVMLMPHNLYLLKLSREAEEAKLTSQIRSSKGDEQPRVRRSNPVGAP